MANYKVRLVSLLIVMNVEETIVKRALGCASFFAFIPKQRHLDSRYIR